MPTFTFPIHQENSKGIVEFIQNAEVYYEKHPKLGIVIRMIEIEGVELTKLFKTVIPEVVVDMEAAARNNWESINEKQ